MKDFVKMIDSNTNGQLYNKLINLNMIAFVDAQVLELYV